MASEKIWEWSVSVFQVIAHYSLCPMNYVLRTVVEEEFRFLYQCKSDKNTIYMLLHSKYTFKRLLVKSIKYTEESLTPALCYLIIIRLLVHSHVHF